MLYNINKYKTNLKIIFLFLLGDISMGKDNLLTNLPEKWSVYSGGEEILNCTVNETLSGIAFDIETGKADFCFLSHKFKVENDADLFEMSADIFIDESSPEESEVHLRASFIDSNGNWHGFSDSQSIYEHGKWFTVKKAFYGKVIDKSIFEVIVSGKSTKACIKNACLTKKELNIPNARTVNANFSISDSKIGSLDFGFGAEADPEFFIGSNKEKILNLDEQWEVIEEKISNMKLHFARMMLLPHIYEPKKGIITLKTKGCEHLFKYLDVFEKNSVRVNLTWWCVSRKDMPWLASFGSDAWCAPPNDSFHAAESLAIFLKQLIEEKGYTCIKDIILMNEPNDSYITEKGLDFEHYAEFYHNFDMCLKKQGIREKITLIGSDDTSGIGWMKKCVNNIDDILDAYSTHVYKWNFYDNSLDEMIQGHVAEYRKLTNKPFIIGEFGEEISGNYILNSVQHGLFLAAFAINALKGGTNGISYWSLFDVYYGIGENNMMNTGLWAYYDRSWETKPSGIVWEMFTKYTAPKDEIYSIDGNGLEGLMFASEARKTIALLNRGSDYISMAINNIPKVKIKKQFIFNKEVWEKSENKPKEWDAEITNGKITGLIPPESFVIIVM